MLKHKDFHYVDLPINGSIQIRACDSPDIDRLTYDLSLQPIEIFVVRTSEEDAHLRLYFPFGMTATTNNTLDTPAYATKLNLTRYSKQGFRLWLTPNETDNLNDLLTQKISVIYTDASRFQMVSHPAWLILRDELDGKAGSSQDSPVLMSLAELKQDLELPIPHNSPPADVNAYRLLMQDCIEKCGRLKRLKLEPALRSELTSLQADFTNNRNTANKMVNRYLWSYGVQSARLQQINDLVRECKSKLRELTLKDAAPSTEDLENVLTLLDRTHAIAGKRWKPDEFKS